VQDGYCTQHLPENQPATPEVKLPPVYTFQVYVAFGMPSEGSWSPREVEGFLWSKYNEGYKLHSTHYIGQNPEGLGMVYVLTLND
jgi:hypothetical protein